MPMLDAATRAAIQDLLLRTTGLRFDEPGVVERLVEAAQQKAVALLEAFKEHHWLTALFWLACGLMFVWVDLRSGGLKPR